MSSHGVGTLMELPAVVASKTSMLFLKGDAPNRHLPRQSECEGGKKQEKELASKVTISLVVTMEVFEVVSLLVFSSGEYATSQASEADIG